MVQLNRHYLNSDLALAHFLRMLDDRRALPKSLLGHLNFSLGRFFTLQPDNADVTRIHDFKWGGILPANPRVVTRVQGRPSSYEAIPGIDAEIAIYIRELMEANPRLVAMFDDYNARPLDKCVEPFRDRGLLRLLEQEVYYLVDHEHASSKTLEMCISESNAIWYSLIVLSEVDAGSFTDTELELGTFDAIAQGCTMIFLRAYDGEGFVIWKRGLD